ncbi:MAG TPA: ABC transporter substrate-binding protein [Vicinamibacterales bacterium]
MGLKGCLALSALCLAMSGCGRFGNATSVDQKVRAVVISQGYSEIIWALGAQDAVVGVDYSSTWPPDVKKVPTVGYHRALSAEGLLSLKPTVIITDGNIGPPQVIEQLRQLNVPIKTFTAKNDSIEGAKALMREMGAYFHKESRADELCRKLDADMAHALDEAKKFSDHPRVAVIHYGRASNVYMLVGASGSGDAGAAGQMVRWAGGEMAIEKAGMTRMASPEIVAQANPDVVLLTEFGYDRLGSKDKAVELPGVATSNAAKNGRIYRVEEHDLMYFGPSSGEGLARLVTIVHKGE